MCGIAGKAQLGGAAVHAPRELLAAMIGEIAHRGPDEYGLYRDDRVGMAISRLSIVDLVTGQQPMANTDGTTWIVFNGEIYNYIELRAELASLGYQFRTRSDTEVVVAAYETWGVECVLRFNGQWAFALWDSVRNDLVLSRDRIGICPLYVCEQGQSVWFASEIKAIFADPDVPRALDPRGIDQTFTSWAPVAPTTAFSGIEAIRPGSYRVYHGDGRVTDRVFWTPTFRDQHEPFDMSLVEATEVLRDKLYNATRLRMIRADVPVGSYLSGGLDSSLIARMGADTATSDFRTFSIGFEDEEFDEQIHQRRMTATLSSRHETILVRRTDIAAAFSDAIHHAEAPVLRTALAPLFLLSKLARDGGIKAVLTGEGADEMLAGYDIFREAKIREYWSRRPDSKLRPLLMSRVYPYLARSPTRVSGVSNAFWRQGLDRVGQPGFAHYPRWMTTSTLKRFFSSELNNALAEQPALPILADLPEQFSKWDGLSQAQYAEIVTLLSPYIISSQGDRMLMAHSVEGRFPFLDTDVVEFANSLPASYKLPRLDEKHILKRVAAGSVPDSIISRKKQPYRAPDAACFFGRNAPPMVEEMVDDVLSHDSLVRAGMFDPRSVDALRNKLRRVVNSTQQQTLSNTDNMAFVGILSTQLLDHLFIRNSRTRAHRPREFTTDVDRCRSTLT
jgi:asparagine synthase (glutamine-hydrolysing)